jgi:peptide/nickel transport system ATP-binding protein
LSALASPVLTVEDLAVTFRTPVGPLRAVRGVSFGLGEGETLAIVGESGCGKSVTALSLLRLLPSPPAEVTGVVRFEGEDLMTMPEEGMREVRGRRIAMVFQDPMSSLNPVRTIGVQMEEVLRVHLGLGRRAARRRSADLLGSVGIPAPDRQLDSYPHQLSGGMRQRVMIAMALSCEPRVLVADEPTTALDVSIQAQILELLRTVTAAHGTAMILISHDLSVVAGLADRIAVMYAGHLMETGLTAGVFAHPHHPYAKGLLECIPRLDRPLTRRLLSIEGGLPDPHGDPAGCPFAPRCEFVMDRCLVEMPPLEAKAPDQQAACWADLSAVLPRTEVTGEPAAASRAAAGEPLVRVEDLRVHFRVGGGPPLRPRLALRAVDGISFDVRRGETLSIVGESGCGKSTTGRALLRLVDVTSGRVVFDGEDLLSLAGDALRRLRPNLQMVFQDPYGSLDPRMSVGDLVGEPLRVHRAAQGHGLRARVHELLEMVGLPAGAADRFPHQLSGGQRQRVGVARALALHPSLVVADEPTSALDVSVRAQILNLMQDLQERLGLTYVFISHDLSIVRHMSSRVAVMYLGKIVEVADRDTLYADPRHPYTQGLLATVPVPDPAVERGRRRAAMRGDVPNPADPPRGCRFNTRCPLAFDRCFVEEPPLVLLADGHEAACFLAQPADPGGRHESPITAISSDAGGQTVA